MDKEARAESAKQLLGNPTFHEALKTMQEEIVAQWGACSATDIKSREWLWMFYQNTLKFEQVLKGFVDTGKLARLERERSKLEKVTSLFK